MDADAGRVRTALRLQAVAARVHHMDCAGFAEEVCDAVDVAGRLGYLGSLHAGVRLAAARGAMPDAAGMTRGDAPGRPDCPGLADGVPGAHGARRPRPVFLHLRAMRRTRDRIGVHALPVLRRPHGRRRTRRSGGERGDPCRLVS